MADNVGMEVTGTNGITKEIMVTRAKIMFKKKIALLKMESFLTYQSSLPALNKKSFSALDRLS